MLLYNDLKVVFQMTNWDGFDIPSFYLQVVKEYEKIIEPFSFQSYMLSNYERVYNIQDTFAIYVGLINYGDTHFKNYMIVFEELLDNDIFKFNFSKFSRKFSSDDKLHIVYKRFHGVWGEAIRDISDFQSGLLSVQEILERASYYQIDSRCEYIEAQLPELKLRERYNQWEGYFYNFIIYELSNQEKIGYAIYCSDNPQIHKTAMAKADDIEWCALRYYDTRSRMDKNIIGTDQDFSRYQFEAGFLSQGVNCDGVMIDLLVEKIEQHKANGWEYRNNKNISSHKLCVAEHYLKYFWISKYVKSKVLRDVLNIGAEIFKDVHEGKYNDEPRYEYLIPENKWKSEQLVYELTKSLYKKNNVIYQHRPFFLRSGRGQMSYDVFICGLNVAIEYQGKQHFEPVEIFGGEEHFKNQVIRDRLKKDLSKKNGVALVHINYWEDISPDLIKEKITIAMSERHE